VLQNAQRAPSNCNTQPRQVHIVSGAMRASLTNVLIAHADSARFSPDAVHSVMTPVNLSQHDSKT
jgi:hypothetical protein